MKRPIIVLYIRSLFLCSFCLLMHDISKTFSSIEGHQKKMNVLCNMVFRANSSDIFLIEGILSDWKKIFLHNEPHSVVLIRYRVRVFLISYYIYRKVLQRIFKHSHFCSVKAFYKKLYWISFVNAKTTRPFKTFLELLFSIVLFLL